MIIAGLAELEQELLLRAREKGLLVWRTKNGTLVPLKDMTDKHLINTINMLHKQEEERKEIEFLLSEAGIVDINDTY